MTGLVGHVKDATNKYNTRLTDMSGKIDSKKDVTKKVQSILHDVMEETQGMLRHNLVMEENWPLFEGHEGTAARSGVGAQRSADGWPYEFIEQESF